MTDDLAGNVEELSIRLHETMLATDLDDPHYLEKTIDLILTSVKDALHFSCAEFNLFRNLDGSIPKKGDIGPNPRLRKGLRLHWTTGVGYEESYMNDATGAIYDIETSRRGPPHSLYDPKFGFEPLPLYDNEEDMSRLEAEGRIPVRFLERERKEIYETECSPADFPRGGFSEFVYQIYLPVTREIPEGREMFGVMCVDTPLDIPLNQPPDAERMKAVLTMTRLAQAPLLTASMVDELRRKNEALKDAHAKIVEQEKIIVEQSMAGGFAHEVRNALSPITTYVTVLLGTDTRKGLLDTLDFAEEDKQMLRDRLLKVRNQAEYALDITGMIMEYAKIESQRASEEVGIKDLLEKILESHADELMELNISCTSWLAYDGPLHASPTQVRQVVENLLLNAEHAVEKTGQKEITLTLERVKGPDTHSPDADRVTISVVDSGCGIDGTIKDKIFRPFFTTRPDKKGAGLGLATSRRIARLYGGDLTFESVAGRTVFTFSLPVGEKAETKASTDER